MIPRLPVILFGLLIVNAGLIAISAVLSLQSMQQHPMLGQQLLVEGVNLHVVDSGPQQSANPLDHRRPTLVLIHGASTSLLDFESSLRPHLEQVARVISIDRPGHGYSERGNAAQLSKRYGLTQQAEHNDWVNPRLQARLIASALEQLGINNAIWIGHSWAGSVVLAALLDESVPISAGVLIAGATHPWESGNAWHVNLAAHPFLGPIFTWQYIETVGRLALDAAVKAVFAPEPVPENYASNTGLALSLRPPTYQHNATDIRRLKGYLAHQHTQYDQIRQPLLSIIGSEDAIVPSRHHHARLSKQLGAWLQSAELTGAGHAPHHTRSETVSRLIINFTNDAVDPSP